MIDPTETFPVGARIYFGREIIPMTVRARGERYMVCTRPKPRSQSGEYTVIDIVEKINGTENMVLGFGAETDAQCREMLERIEIGRSEISYRNRVPLKITKIVIK